MLLQNKFIKDNINYSNMTKDYANTIWNEIVEVVSGGYGFNKSHSASYAKTSYKTAWLKYYYKKEFYASLLTQHGDNEDKIADIIAECKKHNINILPPDINISDNEFEATHDGIRYRLTTIKSIGDSAISEIRKLRPIKSLEDMITRAEKKTLRKMLLKT